jgi:hypothetical protein
VTGWARKADVRLANVCGRCEGICRFSSWHNGRDCRPPPSRSLRLAVTIRPWERSFDSRAPSGWPPSKNSSVSCQECRVLTWPVGWPRAGRLASKRPEGGGSSPAEDKTRVPTGCDGNRGSRGRGRGRGHARGPPRTPRIALVKHYAVGGPDVDPTSNPTIGCDRVPGRRT